MQKPEIENMNVACSAPSLRLANSRYSLNIYRRDEAGLASCPWEPFGCPLSLNLSVRLQNDIQAPYKFDFLLTEPPTS